MLILYYVGWLSISTLDLFNNILLKLVSLSVYFKSVVRSFQWRGPLYAIALQPTRDSTHGTNIFTAFTCRVALRFPMSTFLRKLDNAVTNLLGEWAKLGDNSNCIIPNEATAGDHELRVCRPSGSWSPKCCWVGNYVISQGVWILVFVTWPTSMRVIGVGILCNCQHPFLHWFRHLS